MFSIHYLVSKSRERKDKNIVLENKFKVFEQDLEKKWTQQRIFGLQTEA